MLQRLLLAALFLASALAQTIEPSNSTRLFSAPDRKREWLLLGQSGEGSVAEYRAEVVPLNDAGIVRYRGFFWAHNFLAGPSTAKDIHRNQVAYISCDHIDGNLEAPYILNTVVEQKAKGAILYSQSFSGCNYSPADPPNVPDDFPIFTTVSASNATRIVNALSQPPAAQQPSMANVISNWQLTHADVDSNGQGGTASDSDEAHSPSTAVAMMILYSITGLITALFLVIIVTGALRAHRHPERYGRHDILGRPVQSRARGIARAMLDTIPIVKFGERNETQPKPGPADDVELGNQADRASESHPDAAAPNAARDGAASVEPTAAAATAAAAAAVTDTSSAHPARSTSSPDSSTQAAGADPTDHRATESGDANEVTPATAGAATAMGAAPAPTPAPAADESRPEEALGCSICTDDFEKGQDIRVLPCDHKFHPECVDPWLLNVSGTCPLCRIELRSRIEGTDQVATADASNDGRNDLLAPLEPPASNRASNRFSAVFRDALHLRRVRDAPAEERIAALRQLRQSTDQQRGQQDPAARQPDGGSVNPTGQLAADAETEQSRSRLSRRLHDAFRIRTSRGDEAGGTQSARST